MSADRLLDTCPRCRRPHAFHLLDDGSLLSATPCGQRQKSHAMDPEREEDIQRVLNPDGGYYAGQPVSIPMTRRQRVDLAKDRGTGRFLHQTDDPPTTPTMEGIDRHFKVTAAFGDVFLCRRCSAEHTTQMCPNCNSPETVKATEKIKKALWDDPEPTLGIASAITGIDMSAFSPWKNTQIGGKCIGGCGREFTIAEGPGTGSCSFCFDLPLDGRCQNPGHQEEVAHPIDWHESWPEQETFACLWKYGNAYGQWWCWDCANENWFEPTGG